MKEMIGLYLKRIDRDSDSGSAPVSDPRIVVLSPAISFGSPVIAGTGIPVASRYERYRAGDSVARVADDFRLEIGAVEEAIRAAA
jgi:uncharacterized protein (DUF433 family)